MLGLTCDGKCPGEGEKQEPLHHDQQVNASWFPQGDKYPYLLFRGLYSELLFKKKQKKQRQTVINIRQWACSTFMRLVHSSYVHLNSSHYINIPFHTLSIFFYFLFLFFFFFFKQSLVIFFGSTFNNHLSGCAVWGVHWLLATRNWPLKAVEAKIFCNNDVNQRPWSFWIVKTCVKTWSWCRGEVNIGIKWKSLEEPGYEGDQW